MNWRNVWRRLRAWPCTPGECPCGRTNRFALELSSDRQEEPRGERPGAVILEPEPTAAAPGTIGAVRLTSPHWCPQCGHRWHGAGMCFGFSWENPRELWHLRPGTSQATRSRSAWRTRGVVNEVR